MRAFLVRMPSGGAVMDVVDEGFRSVPVVDAYLRHTRFGKDGAESTTKSYAGALVRFLRWCASVWPPPRPGRTARAREHPTA
jgi:integrase/recombinase XerD